MESNIDVIAVPENERGLLYSSDKEGYAEKCGLIGWLRSDFGNGKQFCYTFWNQSVKLKTQAFKDEFDAVVNRLREPNELLHSLPALAAFCQKHPTSEFDTWLGVQYGFRVETEKYSYYFRSCTRPRDYHVYIYCYLRERLERYTAESGKEKENA